MKVKALCLAATFLFCGYAVYGQYAGPCTTHTAGNCKYEYDADVAENTLDNAQANIGDASRRTGVVDNNSTIANQLSTAMYDIFQVLGLVQRDRAWINGVNHSFDLLTDPVYEQPFYGANDSCTVNGTTYWADSLNGHTENIVGAIQCDLQNGTTLLQTAQSYVQNSFCSPMPCMPTSDSAFNNYVSTANSDLSTAVSQWQTATNDAANLTDCISLSNCPSRQLQEIIFKLYSVWFEQLTQGCSGSAPGGSGCGQEVAVFIQKIMGGTCPTYNGHSYDACFNVIQNTGQVSYMVRASLDDVMGFSSSSTPLEDAQYQLLEALDHVAYRLATDTAKVEEVQSTEGTTVDSLLEDASLYNGAAWGASDSAAFHIMVLLTGFTCSLYCP